MKLLQENPNTQATKPLAGKVALVTGGSRGIGAAIAQRLADDGATVAITYSKSRKAADEVVASINEANGKAFAFKADVASAEETKNSISEVKKVLGKIDILVNNAGVFEGGPLPEIDVEQFDRIFSVNVRGVIATTLAALEVLSQGGRIINISSGAATMTLAGMSVYSASKAALDALTRIWAQDLGARGITVNSVSPGTTVTDMFDKAMPGEEIKEQVISKTALGRLGQPEDIAAAVAFLASKDGGWITGQVIRADGGINF